MRAFKRLLELAPDERRAQEQLKKRYVALRDWDELEAFYATTDKWDELIRVFEREGDDANVAIEERISLLSRVARLWARRRTSADRAARSYEKMLELDADNLDAAVALSPDLRAGQATPRSSPACTKCASSTSRSPTSALVLLRETGLLYEEKLQAIPRRRSRSSWRRSRSTPAQRGTARGLERAGGQDQGTGIACSPRTSRPSTNAIPPTMQRPAAARRPVLAQTGRAKTRSSSAARCRTTGRTTCARSQALDRCTGNRELRRAARDAERKRQELENDPDARKQLAYDIAALTESELNETAEAIEATADHRGVRREKLDAYRALERSNEAAEAWPTWPQVLQHRIDLGPPRTRSSRRSSSVWPRVEQEHLDGNAEAVDCTAKSSRIVPEHEGARAAARELLDDEKHGKPAAEILEPMYESAGAVGQR